MFGTLASKTADGNYLTEGTCSGPLRHTVYKKTGDDGSQYKCPYCGYDVP